VPITTTVLCLLALADSSYLTYTHFAAVKLDFCGGSGLVDCSLVTNSIYSHVSLLGLQVPIVIPGVIWCVAMLALCSPWGWRATQRWVSPLRLACSVAGVGMVLWLVYVELFKLYHICEYCTGVHILTVALFIVILFGTALGAPVSGDDLDEDEEGPEPDEAV
jgi:uncharacterized membrane protein